MTASNTGLILLGLVPFFPKSLNGNSIGDVGAQALAEALKHNNTIQILWQVAALRHGKYIPQWVSHQLFFSFLYFDLLIQPPASSLLDCVVVLPQATPLIFLALNFSSRYSEVRNNSSLSLSLAAFPFFGGIFAHCFILWRDCSCTLSFFHILFVFFYRLWNNGISDTGAEALADALRTSTLKKLK